MGGLLTLQQFFAVKVFIVLVYDLMSLSAIIREFQITIYREHWMVMRPEK